VLDSQAQNLTADSQNFWFLARALARFVSEHGVPPLGGQIPDMTASTDMYIGLQQVYQAKAAHDKKVMKQYVVELLEAAGKSTDSVSDEEVDIFCKNVYNIQVRHLVTRFHRQTSRLTGCVVWTGGQQ
jgi:amyloid beta precursor protein binding protein 1